MAFTTNTGKTLDIEFAGALADDPDRQSFLIKNVRTALLRRAPSTHARMFHPHPTALQESSQEPGAHPSSIGR